MGRITLADVATQVGVSAKTVSNVVNGTGAVSDAVRERVLEAVQRLGYSPNSAARHLRSGTSGMIAFAVPNLREPYFAEFAADVVDAAGRRGMTVLVHQTGGDREAERRFVEGIALPAVDGLAISPLGLTREDLTARTSPAPLILVGEHGAAIRGDDVAHIGIDNVAASRAATEFLLQRGRRRIAAIGVQREGSTETSSLRYTGYREALAHAGIPEDPTLLGVVSQFTRAEGSRAATDLLSAGATFDALFCFNDTMAFGALHSLAAHGLRVPEQVDVMGFDDIEEGRFSLPAFSTVNAGTRLTADLLLDSLSTSAPPRRHIEVPFHLVPRVP